MGGESLWGDEEAMQIMSPIKGPLVLDQHQQMQEPYSSDL